MATFWQYLIVMGLSATPILELKASIPFGVITYGIPVLTCFIIAILGAIIPAPFVILFVRKVLDFFAECKIKPLNKLGHFIHCHTEKKAAKVRAGSLFTLFIFVAIPLPGTGVWTGSLIAGLLDLKLKHALPTIFLGNIVAGILMLFVTHSINMIV
ncbi:MAG: small multi-drug export protein [Eubacteriales bacterium]